MKWSLFKNKVKDDLSAHRSEVEVDALWSAIEPQVDAINHAKRKKRRGFIWLLFAGVLLAGGTAGYFFLGNTNDIENVIVENHFKEKNDEINNKNLAEEKPKEKITETSTIENKTTEINEQLIVSENKTVRQSNLTDKGSGAERIKNKTGIIAENKLNKNNEGINDFEKKEIVLTNDFINAISENDAETFLKNKPKKINQRTKVFSVPYLPAKKLELPDVLPPSIKVSESKGAANVLAEENTEPGGLPEKPLKQKKIQFSVGLNGGISYADRNLGGRATDSIGLLGLREIYEKQLETSHLGVQFAVEHKSGLSFTTGLQYTRMVELYERNEVVEVVDSIFGVAYYAVLPNNDTTAVMGVVPHTTISTLEKRYYNKYRMLDIPLLVGYRRVMNDWSLGAQAGVFANISINTEGRVLKNEIGEEELKEIIKSNIGLSYYAGFSVGYLLNENIEISVSPYGRYFSKSFTKDDYGLSQKYFLVGLDARFRYWF